MLAEQFMPMISQRKNLDLLSQIPTFLFRLTGALQ